MVLKWSLDIFAFSIMVSDEHIRPVVRSSYNLLDLVAFVVPLAASIRQLVIIYKDDPHGSSRVLSFSVLIVFIHMVRHSSKAPSLRLLYWIGQLIRCFLPCNDNNHHNDYNHHNKQKLSELRINRNVCKYVSIIQQAIVEIQVFFFIFAAGIVAFTISMLHMIHACPVGNGGCVPPVKNPGSTDGPNFPQHFFGALSATYFFMVMENLSFSVYFFATQSMGLTLLSSFCPIVSLS